MMQQKGNFRHGASEALRAYIIELPYEGEALSMYILLPPFAPDAIQETISRLNASSLREAMDQNQLYHDKIEVGLPRFKIQQTIQLNKVTTAPPSDSTTKTNQHLLDKVIGIDMDKS